MSQGVCWLACEVCCVFLAISRTPWKAVWTPWRPLTSSFFTRCRELEEVQLPTDFFNRIQEIKMMNNLLKSDPQLSITKGNKSLLLKKVIMELKKVEKLPCYTSTRETLVLTLLILLLQCLRVNLQIDYNNLR